MPHVLVLATGGTISSRTRPDGAAVAADPADRLLGSVPALPAGVTVETQDVLRVNSFALTHADLRTIQDAVAEALARDDVDGVVVTHGTDTLEETAFLLDLVTDDPRPVVLTGAQRSADDPAGDGPGNLRDAIVVAASPDARGAGVLAVFASRILAADGLVKARTLDPDAFAARDGAPLGRVTGDEVRIARLPRALPILPAPTPRFDRIRVDCVSVHPGADAVLFRAAIAAGAAGVVVIGTGAGNANRALVPEIRATADAGVLVALGTRVAHGPVAAIYGDGGAVDAVAAGAVPIGRLSVAQARILVALLLDHHPVDEARRMLAAAADPETRIPTPAGSLPA
ncbi:asparaginase [Clavibacter michiganensis]|uniref:asparaginase n=1 Tax=Clavibacter michiganensis TaxID=28447 RepID=UPI000A36CD6E|nr:asparaginase [Clavibacter michiganensis]MDO4098630.1 asparaginase [Clavibacter michiganensis]MDO4126501.1 asparaginase [Clavibacter michiganensis]NIY60037.1 asparaginase [Clavibacter michiganensis subsp. michiganensis]OUE26209.1 L-asparaginase [Clavibacter michiganensis subsp. michiganensis]QXP03891.1 asparaginase [Clavibacter michiganensis subsp. michiganensis]